MRIKSKRGRGGGVERVLYERISGVVEQAIQINLVYKKKTEPTNASATPVVRDITVRALPGRLSTLTVFQRKLFLYGTFVRERRTRDSQKTVGFGPGRCGTCGSRPPARARDLRRERCRWSSAMGCRTRWSAT